MNHLYEWIFYLNTLPYLQTTLVWLSEGFVWLNEGRENIVREGEKAGYPAFYPLFTTFSKTILFRVIKTRDHDIKVNLLPHNPDF